MPDMNKASLKRHADFRAKVVTLLKAHGAAVRQDDASSVKLSIHVRFVGPIEFTMFKGDGGNRPKNELYSLFVRLDYPSLYDPNRREIFQRGIANLNKMTGRDTMSDNGKWNIHFSKAEDVIEQLEDRLDLFERLSLG